MKLNSRTRATTMRQTEAVLLLGLALTAWVATVWRMRGMDAGPGTDLGGLGFYLGIWVTMTAAMMLPSALPAVTLCAHVRRAADAGWFVVGYLTAWTIDGLVFYGVYRAVRAWAPPFLAWDRSGPLVAGAALILAGGYQLTPLKQACLRRCRSPIGLLMRSRSGAAGAVIAGIKYGMLCVGCCLGLMLALFALGVMSLAWMALIGLAILVEKVSARGRLWSGALAAALVGLGIWVAVAPETVPLLTQPPHGNPAMKAMGAMR